MTAAVQPSLWDHLDIDPTPAMRRGDQTVDQCGWCGTIVITPHAERPRCCPSCDQRGQSDGTWWAQSLPIAGLTAAGVIVDDARIASIAATKHEVTGWTGDRLVLRTLDQGDLFDGAAP